MPSSPQPVEVKDPGHALVTPGHAPVTTASNTPGHAPVDATLAEPKPKKIRTLSSDPLIDDIIWAKTVERNAATKVGKDDFSTKEGIDRLLFDLLRQDPMQIFFGDWTDLPRGMTVVTASGKNQWAKPNSARDEFRYLTSRN